MQELHLVLCSFIFIFIYTAQILSHLNNVGSNNPPKEKASKYKRAHTRRRVNSNPCGYLVQYLTKQRRVMWSSHTCRRSWNITSTPLPEVWPPLGLLLYPETHHDLAVGEVGWREQCKKTTNDNAPNTQASPQLLRNDFSVGLANNDPRETIALLAKAKICYKNICHTPSSSLKMAPACCLKNF